MLNRFNNEKSTCYLYIYDSSRGMNKNTPYHRGRISFTYDKQKLRPYRYEVIAGNTYHFLKAKDVNGILSKVELIVIPPHDKPKNIGEFLELFNFLKLNPPKILPVCTNCLQDYKLTRLTRDTSYDLFDRTVCKQCASNEIKTEFIKRGIPLTQSSRKYYMQQLERLRRVSDVIAVLWEPREVTQDKEKTLFDVIPADLDSKPYTFEKFLSKTSKSNFLDGDLIKHWKKIGISSLLPVQRLAIENGLIEKKDMLIVAGTSSGKTFIGELAGLHNWKQSGKKFLYVTPLVALSNQKYESFKKRYSSIGARVVLRVGKSRIDAGDESVSYPEGNVQKADIIVGTFEAVDWLFRSGQWKKMGQIGTFVIDEFQLLSDEERGTEVDGLISRVRNLFPKTQIIGLSATIGNDQEIANEFNLKLVDYMKRPIPLERHLVIADNDEEKVDLIVNLVDRESKIKSSTNHKGQSLIFTNTRRKVQQLASQLKSEGIRSSYYHAGMTYWQRKKIETAFERGEIEALTTTMALGAGTDFPVSQVIFESPSMGARWITIAEFHQMSGRAGRYGFHDIGKAVILATPGGKIYQAQEKSEEQVAFEILTGEIEDIDGSIDLEQECDQILAFISAAYPVPEIELQKYYEKLFFRTSQLSLILKELISRGLITNKDNKWYITSLGRAISESFLPPFFGYDIAKKTKLQSVKTVAIEIAPFESMHITNKMQGHLERALKRNISTRFLSDAILDILTSSQLLRGEINPFLVDRIKLWNGLFFDCKCKENPFCLHPVWKISELVLDLRLEGLKPSEIARELANSYDLLAYQGDLLNWLDEIIHAVKSVGRLANAMKQDEIIKESNDLALSIEMPKSNLIEDSSIKNRIMSKQILNETKISEKQRNQKPKRLQRKTKKLHRDSNKNNRSQSGRKS